MQLLFILITVVVRGVCALLLGTATTSGIVVQLILMNR